MAVSTYQEIARHFGHEITVDVWGNEDNASITCETCSEILIDFDNNSEIGTCDDCETTYDVGSQIDHCADCGTCWEHCKRHAE